MKINPHNSYFEPSTINELRDIIKLANSNEMKIRLIDSHSSTNFSFNDYLVSLKNFDKILEINNEKLEVKVETGIKIDRLNYVLYQNNMALSVLGNHLDQSLSNAISLGHHGTGLHYGILNSYITEIDMMLANGEIKTYSKYQFSRSDEFSAVILSLNSLGIIISVTIQCESAFHLEQIEYPAKFDDILSCFSVYTKCCEYFRIVWYPDADGIICYNASKINRKVVSKPKNWLLDLLINYYLIGLLYMLATFIKFSVSVINIVYFKLKFIQRKKYSGKSFNIFKCDSFYRHRLMEVAVPNNEASFYLLKLKAFLDNNTNITNKSFIVDISFAKSDNIWLSPCYGQDTCFISILSLKYFDQNHEQIKELKSFSEKLMIDCNGKPSWNVKMSCDIRKNDLSELYTKFDDFCKLRDSLDPKEIFLSSNNKHLFLSN